jgi:hypothetical protein
MKATNGGYERTDANIRSISRFIIALLIFIGFSLALMQGLFRFLYQTEQADMPAPTPMEAQRVVPPEPRLQINPVTDVEALRRREQERLDSYGWVDKNAGVVRIPIHRAMDLILERGLPTPAPKPQQKRNVTGATASKKQ